MRLIINWLGQHWPFAFVVLVGIINIVLNSWVKRAADAAPSYSLSIFSKDFGIAFSIGICSILCLLLVYKHQISLGRGLLLMGATSILGGVLWAVLFKGYRPIISE